MKLRFEGDRIRFRITVEELGLLQSGERIESAMPTPLLTPSRYAFEATADKGMALVVERGFLILRVPQMAVGDLAGRAPDKEGITEAVVNIDGSSSRLTLEVDIKRRPMQGSGT